MPATRYWSSKCYGCGSWICVDNCYGVTSCPACQVRPVPALTGRRAVL